MSKIQTSSPKSGVSHHFLTKLPPHVVQKVSRQECASLKGARSYKWNIQAR